MIRKDGLLTNLPLHSHCSHIQVLVPSLDALLTTIRSVYPVSGSMVSAAQGLPPQQVAAVASTSASINASVATALQQYGPTVDSLRGFTRGLNSTAATISAAGKTANAYSPQVCSSIPGQPGIYPLPLRQDFRPDPLCFNPTPSRSL